MFAFGSEKLRALKIYVYVYGVRGRELWKNYNILTITIILGYSQSGFYHTTLNSSIRRRLRSDTNMCYSSSSHFCHKAKYIYKELATRPFLSSPHSIIPILPVFRTTATNFNSTLTLSLIFPFFKLRILRHNGW